jgi:hypothetical protein
MNEVRRYLIDKREITKDNVRYYRLFFFDSMDGIVVTFDAPIMKSRGIPSFDENMELPEVPEKVEVPKDVVTTDIQESYPSIVGLN